MAKRTDNRYRPRLSVPETDVQVVQWFKMQSDISLSVRHIVKDALRKYGMADVGCLAVKPGVRRGRPKGSKNAVKAQEGGGEDG